MAILFPSLDSAIGILFMVGSPGIGYVILRCVVISSKYWKGWKRLVGASTLGAGWFGGIFYIFNPLIHAGAAIPLLIENFAYAGMGLFLLTAIASLTNRLIIARALANYFPRAGKNAPSPAFESAVPYGRGYNEMTYKPSQLRAPPSRVEKTFEQPVMEKGEDVLALLKEENFEQGKKKHKPFTSGEWKPEGGEEEIEEEENEHVNVRKHTPMEDLGEFEGFEETLAQLKRDLKDFNENVAGPTKRAHHRLIGEKL